MRLQTKDWDVSSRAVMTGQLINFRLYGVPNSKLTQPILITIPTGSSYRCPTAGNVANASQATKLQC